jgi:hypothetical protein
MAAKNPSGINIKKSTKGALHKTLGVPADKPIPVAKLKQAVKSPNAQTRQRAQFALNARRFNH